jgi:hypothetical protein
MGAYSTMNRAKAAIQACKAGRPGQAPRQKGGHGAEQKAYGHEAVAKVKLAVRKDRAGSGVM